MKQAFYPLVKKAGGAGKAGGEKSLSWKGGYKNGFGIKRSGLIDRLIENELEISLFKGNERHS
jgi:hypothetical protein